MPHIAQHEAAELWELARDHYVSATTLSLLINAVQDPQLRSVLAQHGQRHQQIGQQLQQFLQEPGSQSQGSFQGGFQDPHHQTSSIPYSTGTTWTNPHSGGIGSTGYPPTGSGLTPQDVMAAAACLQECKSFAVKSMIGATEASQPARNFLFQVAGEHLRMAEEHYHWLDQRGFYASPRADSSAIHDYVQKLNTISSASQQMQQMPFTAMPQAVAQAMPSLQGIAQPIASPWTSTPPPSYTAGPIDSGQTPGQGQDINSEHWYQYAQQHAPQLVPGGQHQHHQQQ